MRDIVIRLLACVLALVAAGAMRPVHAAGDPRVLVLGCVSDDPKADYASLKPLLDYVVPRMAGAGVRTGRILMARDVRQMGSYLRRGRVDWVTGTATTGMLLQARAGARPLLLRERNGASRDRTMFFVRSDSPIASMADLHGHSVALPGDASLPAYLLPMAHLLGRGVPLRMLASPMDAADDPNVGYLFARSELNVATWVRKRLVDVGTISRLEWDNPQRFPASWRSDFRVIDATPEYPVALEMLRADLAPGVRARLQELLLGASVDPDASEALLQFAGTTRFLAVDAAAEAALHQVGDGIARVRSEGE